jgi:hypothetical protein
MIKCREPRVRRRESTTAHAVNPRRGKRGAACVKTPLCDVGMNQTGTWRRAHYSAGIVKLRGVLRRERRKLGKQASDERVRHCESRDRSCGVAGARVSFDVGEKLEYFGRFK